MTTANEIVRNAIATTARARFFTGHGIETLSVMVDADGAVRPWDAVAGHYTMLHALSPRAERRIARLAGVDTAAASSDPPTRFA